MTDSTNAASTAVAPTAGQPEELKSKDTTTYQKLLSEADSKAKPEVPAREAKPKAEPKALKEPVVDDADPQAEHPKTERLEPWMRKRLERAEEKGRKQALSEFSQLLGSNAPRETPEPQVEVTQGIKTLADFDHDIEKYTDYLADVKVDNAFKKREAKEKQTAQESAAQEARKVFDKRREDFEAKAGVTWEDVISVEVDIPQAVVDLIEGHPRDLYLGHYLVTHPDALEALRGKSRLEIATALADIDATMNGEAKPVPVTKIRELPPKTTKAPPPPAELPSGSNVTKSIENMTTEERIAEWKRQKAAKQRR